MNQLKNAYERYEKFGKTVGADLVGFRDGSDEDIVNSEATIKILLSRGLIEVARVALTTTFEPKGGRKRP